ncbi:efflux RND transporter periplasmic adaptor subunit [Pseudoduganella sp. DS3]|uniref:Efflux RND transporter periplasmic adaptor subunit n=1 Tax=Pseudoduganella guangdongensis TaxID=2692179 RepID=A0A6N9HIB1_9BURK|nr:efflux RND transporter periplasmic adaptor subunit [Pseudoduganella guangdongensis]MYN02833.1 efflux RND transporter periplasmic adaptor subunit [Pseudoduganella guangdongensis]
MKKKTLAVVVGLAVLIGGGAWYASKGTAEQGAPGQGGGKGKGEQGPTTVNVVAPQRQDVPVNLSANGTVSPISTVDLHPQTTSTIVKVHVKEGQFVKQGELMFSLDARTEAANVAKADAQVAKDRATLADLERQYKRAQELLAQNFLAQSAVDTLRSQVESARAVLEADIAAARASKVDQSYTQIRAPLSGRVGAINVYPGSLVQLSTSLATVTQLNPINVAFTVPESSLAALLDAQRAGKVPVQAFQNNSDKPINGQLSFVDNTVDPVAGVIRVKAQFDNADTRLWPGQYVNTKLTVNTLKDALVVPQNAIISNTKGTFVYTVAPDQTAKMSNVKRVHGFGALAVVTGLNGDEKIIVEGKQNLRPGGKIRIAEPAVAQNGKGQKKGKQE